MGIDGAWADVRIRNRPDVTKVTLQTPVGDGRAACADSRRREERKTRGPARRPVPIVVPISSALSYGLLLIARVVFSHLVTLLTLASLLVKTISHQTSASAVTLINVLLVTLVAGEDPLTSGVAVSA